ncbi:MAG: hypothetical protein AAGF07_02235 [Patescibacteria group bacterium]
MENLRSNKDSQILSQATSPASELAVKLNVGSLQAVEISSRLNQQLKSFHSCFNKKDQNEAQKDILKRGWMFFVNELRDANEEGVASFLNQFFRRDRSAGISVPMVEAINSENGSYLATIKVNDLYIQYPIEVFRKRGGLLGIRLPESPKTVSAWNKLVANNSNYYENQNNFLVFKLLQGNNPNLERENSALTPNQTEEPTPSEVTEVEDNQVEIEPQTYYLRVATEPDLMQRQAAQKLKQTKQELNLLRDSLEDPSKAKPVYYLAYITSLDPNIAIKLANIRDSIYDPELNNHQTENEKHVRLLGLVRDLKILLGYYIYNYEFAKTVINPYIEALDKIQPNSLNYTEYIQVVQETVSDNYNSSKGASIINQIETKIKEIQTAQSENSFKLPNVIEVKYGGVENPYNIDFYAKSLLLCIAKLSDSEQFQDLESNGFTLSEINNSLTAFSKKYATNQEVQEIFSQLKISGLDLDSIFPSVENTSYEQQGLGKVVKSKLFDGSGLTAEQLRESIILLREHGGSLDKKYLNWSRVLKRFQNQVQLDQVDSQILDQAIAYLESFRRRTKLLESILYFLMIDNTSDYGYNAKSALLITSFRKKYGLPNLGQDKDSISQLYNECREKLAEYNKLHLTGLKSTNQTEVSKARQGFEKLQQQFSQNLKSKFNHFFKIEYTRYVRIKNPQFVWDDEKRFEYANDLSFWSDSILDINVADLENMSNILQILNNQVVNIAVYKDGQIQTKEIHTRGNLNSIFDKVGVVEAFIQTQDPTSNSKNIVSVSPYPPHSTLKDGNLMLTPFKLRPIKDISSTQTQDAEVLDDTSVEPTNSDVPHSLDFYEQIIKGVVSEPFLRANFEKPVFLPDGWEDLTDQEKEAWIESYKLFIDQGEKVIPANPRQVEELTFERQSSLLDKAPQKVWTESFEDQTALELQAPEVETGTRENSVDYRAEFKARVDWFNKFQKTRAQIAESCERLLELGTNAKSVGDKLIAEYNNFHSLFINHFAKKYNIFHELVIIMERSDVVTGINRAVETVYPLLQNINQNFEGKIKPPFKELIIKTGKFDFQLDTSQEIYNNRFVTDLKDLDYEKDIRDLYKFTQNSGNTQDLVRTFNHRKVIIDNVKKVVKSRLNDKREGDLYGLILNKFEGVEMLLNTENLDLSILNEEIILDIIKVLSCSFVMDPNSNQASYITQSRLLPNEEISVNTFHALNGNPSVEVALKTAANDKYALESIKGFELSLDIINERVSIYRQSVFEPENTLNDLSSYLASLFQNNIFDALISKLESYSQQRLKRSEVLDTLFTLFVIDPNIKQFVKSNPRDKLGLVFNYFCSDLFVGHKELEKFFGSEAVNNNSSLQFSNTKFNKINTALFQFNHDSSLKSELTNPKHREILEVISRPLVLENMTNIFQDIYKKNNLADILKVFNVLFIRCFCKSFTDLSQQVADNPNQRIAVLYDAEQVQKNLQPLLDKADGYIRELNGEIAQEEADLQAEFISTGIKLPEIPLAENTTEGEQTGEKPEVDIDAFWEREKLVQQFQEDRKCLYELCTKCLSIYDENPNNFTATNLMELFGQADRFARKYNITDPLLLTSTSNLDVESIDNGVRVIINELNNLTNDFGFLDPLEVKAIEYSQSPFHKIEYNKDYYEISSQAELEETENLDELIMQDITELINILEDPSNVSTLKKIVERHKILIQSSIKSGISKFGAKSNFVTTLEKLVAGNYKVGFNANRNDLLNQVFYLTQALIRPELGVYLFNKISIDKLNELSEKEADLGFILVGGKSSVGSLSDKRDKSNTISIIKYLLKQLDRRERDKFVLKGWFLYDKKLALDSISIIIAQNFYNNTLREILSKFQNITDIKNNNFVNKLASYSKLGGFNSENLFPGVCMTEVHSAFIKSYSQSYTTSIPDEFYNYFAFSLQHDYSNKGSTTKYEYSSQINDQFQKADHKQIYGLVVKILNDYDNDSCVIEFNRLVKTDEDIIDFFKIAELSLLLSISGYEDALKALSKTGAKYYTLNYDSEVVSKNFQPVYDRQAVLLQELNSSEVSEVEGGQISNQIVKLQEAIQEATDVEVLTTTKKTFATDLEQFQVSIKEAYLKFLESLSHNDRINVEAILQQVFTISSSRTPNLKSLPDLDSADLGESSHQDTQKIFDLLASEISDLTKLRTLFTISQDLRNVFELSVQSFISFQAVSILDKRIVELDSQTPALVQPNLKRRKDFLINLISKSLNSETTLDPNSKPEQRLVNFCKYLFDLKFSKEVVKSISQIAFLESRFSTYSNYLLGANDDSEINTDLFYNQDYIVDNWSPSVNSSKNVTLKLLQKFQQMLPNEKNSDWLQY